VPGRVRQRRVPSSRIEQERVTGLASDPNSLQYRIASISFLTARKEANGCERAWA
jgi:hypothetical protein